MAKLRCWSRKNKQQKRYVVCTGSKGQTKRRSKRLRKKQKGGRKLRCWSRKNKQQKRYVVCTGSKGQTRRRSKRLRKKQRGGKSYSKRQMGGNKGAPLMPQTLVNLSRSLTHAGGNVINGIRGYPETVSPSPQIQPELLKPAKASMNTTQIGNIYTSSQKAVGAL